MMTIENENVLELALEKAVYELAENTDFCAHPDTCTSVKTSCTQCIKSYFIEKVRREILDNE